MPTAPNVTEVFESAWNSNSTPKTSTPNFSVAVGDYLVAVAVAGDGQTTFTTLPTNSGTAFTWTQIVTIGTATSSARIAVWKAVATAAQSMTVTCARTGTANLWGFSVYKVDAASGGIGTPASVQITSGSGVPNLNCTTPSDHCAILVFSVDWNAVDGTTRTWRTAAGALTETTYFRDSVNYTIYGGVHADAGVAGTYATGLSAPTGQRYTTVAVPIIGVSGGGADLGTVTSSASAASTGSATTPSIVSGTSSGAAASAGTPIAASVLSGSTAAAAASTGSLNAAPAMTGAAAAAGASSGTLSTLPVLAGTTAAIAASSATPNTPSIVSGSSAAAAASTGTPIAKPVLSATSAAAAASTGTPIAAPVLSGSSSAVSVTTGTITVPGSAAISGTSSATAASTGQPIAPPVITGSSSATASTTGSPKTVSILTGSSGALAGASGLLKTPAILTGSSAATSLTTGTLSVPGAAFAERDMPTLLVLDARTTLLILDARSTTLATDPRTTSVGLDNRTTGMNLDG